MVSFLVNDEQVKIPERFHEVTTWKGPTDSGYLKASTRHDVQRLVVIGSSTAKTDSEGAS